VEEGEKVRKGDVKKMGMMGGTMRWEGCEDISNLGEGRNGFGAVNELEEGNLAWNSAGWFWGWGSPAADLSCLCF
jgi:hypothetical protein